MTAAEAKNDSSAYRKRFTSFFKHNDFSKHGYNEAPKHDKSPKQEKPSIPVELYKDFFRLGVMPGSTLETCREAYKNLLKKHHPDRHSGTKEMMNAATEITSCINASFQRLSFWFKTGQIEN